jgi:hypothetical protein
VPEGALTGGVLTEGTVAEGTTVTDGTLSCGAAEPAEPAEGRCHDSHHHTSGLASMAPETAAPSQTCVFLQIPPEKAGRGVPSRPGVS